MDTLQLMPDEIQYDASATPPQFTNNADIVIEQGTHVRVKIIGLRTEVGEMWAIGSINGDFLGYGLQILFLSCNTDFMPSCLQA